MLYAPSILLLVAAVWLAIVGDGRVFGVIVLVALSMTVGLAAREQRRASVKRRREHGR